jgi:hypothetical protein
MKIMEELSNEFGFKIYKEQTNKRLYYDVFDKIPTLKDDQEKSFYEKMSLIFRLDSIEYNKSLDKKLIDVFNNVDGVCSVIDIGESSERPLFDINYQKWGCGYYYSCDISDKYPNKKIKLKELKRIISDIIDNLKTCRNDYPFITINIENIFISEEILEEENISNINIQVGDSNISNSNIQK